MIAITRPPGSRLDARRAALAACGPILLHFYPSIVSSRMARKRSRISGFHFSTRQFSGTFCVAARLLRLSENQRRQRCRATLRLRSGQEGPGATFKPQKRDSSTAPRAQHEECWERRMRTASLRMTSIGRVRKNQRCRAEEPGATSKPQKNLSRMRPLQTQRCRAALRLRSGQEEPLPTSGQAGATFKPQKRDSSTAPRGRHEECWEKRMRAASLRMTLMPGYPSASLRARRTRHGGQARRYV
jgi:hypothetical protein